jgi:hypothetical protein
MPASVEGSPRHPIADRLKRRARLPGSPRKGPECVLKSPFHWEREMAFRPKRKFPSEERGSPLSLASDLGPMEFCFDLTRDLDERFGGR